MTNIIDKFRGLKTAKQLEDAIPDIEAALGSAKAELARLDDNFESALLDSPSKDFEEINNEISAARGNVKTLEVALTGTKKRLDVAAEREFMAGIEKDMAKAQKKGKSLLKSYLAIHQAAETLTQHLVEVRNFKKEIQSANEMAGAANRRDLRVKWPLQALSQLTGRQIFEPCDSFKLPGYFPPHPDGPVLARLAELGGD